ncbi:hypothetical protein ACFL3I_07860, partial [Pseudomonadota bacterium]
MQTITTIGQTRAVLSKRNSARVTKKTIRQPGVGKLRWLFLLMLCSALGAQSAYAVKTLELVAVGIGEHSDVSAFDYDAVDELLFYEYDVTNTGDEDISGPVTIVDASISVKICPNLTVVGNGDAFLNPGETIQCEGLHRVVQADLDAPGSVISNPTATADGAVSNVSGVTLLREPLGVLVAGAGPDNDYDSDTDVLNYTYVVTNYTNETITLPVVTDDKAVVSACLPTGNLASGSSVSCTGTYDVVTGDLSPISPEKVAKVITQSFAEASLPALSYVASTISAQASDNSYSDSANGFLTAGFAYGDRISVTGLTGANNIVGAVVTAIEAGKLTIGGVEGDVIVDEAAGASVTITRNPALISAKHDLSLYYADPDLPGALANIETIPAGSLVIPMDNVYQSTGTDFNLFAYGLANKFLQNNIPVKWAIRSDKVKLQGFSKADGGASTLTDAKVKTSGTTTVDGGTTILTDAAANFVADGVVVGDLVVNTSDGDATGEVTDVTTNTLTITAYTGGTTIENGDAYNVIRSFIAAGVMVGDLLTNESDGYATGEVSSVDDITLGITSYTGTSIDAFDTYVLDGYDFGVNSGIPVNLTYTLSPRPAVSYTTNTIKAKEGNNGKFEDSLKQFVLEGFLVGDIISVTGFSNSVNNVVDAEILNIKDDGKDFEISGSFNVVDENAGNLVTVTRAAQNISADSLDDSINITSGDFLAAGFELGDVVAVTGFTNPANNIVNATVTYIDEHKLTFAGESLFDETATGSITFQTINQSNLGDRTFYGGPFIVSNDDPANVADALNWVESFNTDVATDAVTAFVTTADVDVDIRYTLTHKPFLAVSNIKTAIHTDVLDAAGIPGGGPDIADNCPAPEELGYDANTCNYSVIDPVNLQRLSCATLHMEPHRDEPSQNKNGTIDNVLAVQNAVEAFLLTGGNFLAQCHAVQYFENSD